MKPVKIVMPLHYQDLTKKKEKIRRGAYVYRHNVLKITYIFTEIEKIPR